MDEECHRGSSTEFTVEICSEEESETKQERALNYLQQLGLKVMSTLREFIT